MKHRLKKMFVLLLACALMFSMFPFSTASAAGTGGVQERLNQVVNDYPNGSYFTVNGKACTHDKYHCCNNCNLLEIYKAKGKSLPFSQTGGLWTCKAFAAYVTNQVFETRLAAGSTLDLIGEAKQNGNRKSSYQSAKPGDLIYFYNGNGKNTHIAVCMGTTNDAVIIYECNATGGTAQVSYRTIPYSEVCTYRSGKYISIYRAKNYDDINAKGSETLVANGTYTLTPACAPNARLDVANGSYDDYANVQIYTDNGTAAQQWEIIRLENGYYKIISKQSGKALDKYTASKGSGTSVMQFTWREGDQAQEWSFENAGDGYYYIIPRSPFGLCLDVSAGQSADKTNVQVYTANQSNAQKWKLTSVGQESTQPGNGPSAQTGHWGSWSDWSDSAVSGSDSRQVETRQVEESSARTEYRYGRYVYFDSRRHECWCGTYMTKLFGSATLQYSDWSTIRYNPGPKNWTCANCKGNHVGVDHYTNGMPYWHEYFLPDGDYYWEEARTVAATQKTQYRYRDWISG